MTTLTYKHIKKHADTLTPVEIFMRLSGAKKFLLESSVQHEVKGKYSYIGSNPYEEIIGEGNETTVINHRTKETTKYKLNPIRYIKSHMPKIDIDLPFPFTGGAIGYIGYDAVRQFKHIGAELEDDLNMPDVHLMLYEDVIIYEHHNETAHVIAMNIKKESEDKLDARINQMASDIATPLSVPSPHLTNVNFKPAISEEQFTEKVTRAIEYIHAGEAQQIVLSQRMEAEMQDDPFSFYRKLRMANPSPYMFYIDFNDYFIVGTSPESLIQTTGKHITTNPIAGTRHRGKTAKEDHLLMKELLNDKKERDEHNMLVELSKQDLKEVCEEKEISVPIYMEIEKYEHVMHIVSEVHGEINDDLSSMDALIACMPAGTVSGAPKIRAMQLINELEDKNRGFYAGGIGYITFNHDINLAIAIRSLVIKDKTAYLQVGAGIIEHSIPAKEYEETLHKARSLMELNLNQEETV